MRTVAETEQIAASFFAEQAHFLETVHSLSPQMWESAYNTGALIGAVTDNQELPSDLRQFARNCRDEFRAEVGVNQYRFATATGTGAMHQDWKGKLCLAHLPAMRMDRMSYREAQLTGDCVAVAMRSMRDKARIFDIAERDLPYDYVKRSATADLYAMRGHTGAGASPSRIANAATKIGILLETEITSPDGEVWDFRDYKSYYKLGMRYGRTGLPTWIYDLNADKGPKQAAECQTLDEVLTALWNGCGVGLGSSMGVSKNGGKDGVAFLSGLSGSWQHEMQMLFFDDRRKYHRDTLIGWDQTWGNWNNITEADWPDEYGPKPEGAYVLTATDSMKHVRGGECHAFSDSIGFRPRRQATLGAEGLI
tara:strand:- start:1149 stop:2243 length:1095 start_codon:yes stop_codon:yes gene_type:complete